MNRFLGLLAAILLSFAFLGAAASAAGPSNSTTEQSGQACSLSKGDLSLDSDVHMDSMRFDVVPKHALLRTGGENERGGYTVRRTNIPKHPLAGVTYKNVRIQTHVSATFVDPHAPSTRC